MKTLQVAELAWPSKYWAMAASSLVHKPLKGRSGKTSKASQGTNGIKVSHSRPDTIIARCSGYCTFHRTTRTRIALGEYAGEKEASTRTENFK